MCPVCFVNHVPGLYPFLTRGRGKGEGLDQLRISALKPNVATLKERARQLRRDQTDAEKRLWACLRSRQLSGFTFRRQFVIGPFITDFCCFETTLGRRTRWWAACRSNR